MIDITAKAEAWWSSLKLTAQQRADAQLRALIIEAFEQGWMQHNVH